MCQTICRVSRDLFFFFVWPKVPHLTLLYNRKANLTYFFLSFHLLRVARQVWRNAEQPGGEFNIQRTHTHSEWLSEPPPLFHCHGTIHILCPLPPASSPSSSSCVCSKPVQRGPWGQIRPISLLKKSHKPKVELDVMLWKDARCGHETQTFSLH